MPELSLQVSYPLRDFSMLTSLNVPSGVTVLIGPNGSGKTTLLKLLSGLLSPVSGSIEVAGRCLFDSSRRINISPQGRQVGMVFQDFALFPHLRVEENIAFGLKAQRKPRGLRKNRVAEVMDRMGLTCMAREPVTALSGGQRQKVALARTLVTDPDLLLLDEPTSALDQTNRGEMRRWLTETLSDLSIPTLLVTHDINDVSYFRKRIAVMERGRIRQQGSFHQLLNAPETSFIADFAGVNFLSGSCIEENAKKVFISKGGSKFLATFENAQPGPASLTIAPWEVSLYRELPAGSPRNIMPGKVVEVIITGDTVRVTILGNDKLVAELSYGGYKGLGKPDVGDPVVAVFKARKTKVENC